MDLYFTAATEADLPFARDLARRAMLGYYREFDLLWLDEAFDQAWFWREQWLLSTAEGAVGFLSLSADARALYIRELHLIESARGQGIGSRVLDQTVRWARERSLPLVRLTVFNSNPAQVLYRRKGFVAVGDEECFVRMERPAFG
ncbi:GNAT family N-acetyltransferase [Pseudomonas sp. LS1212]|uniref:GNAT family N-acetyltransferase n=1 Tax=Pseudomonas sp. LS1212 TaxID=2972478 RepID=UPI00215BB8AC|nr:GNAT family N-acetyltransferase [Pseudomonas sp. LS1212]UVJ45915.1 GNAT family N-acetyltransferase [Pseudomonas sp. LS1212]